MYLYEVECFKLKLEYEVVELSTRLYFLRRKIEALLLVCGWFFASTVYLENPSAVSGVQQDQYFGAE